MHSHSHIDIRRTLKGPSFVVPYEKVIQSILGEHYDLSLTICGDSLARRMYREHRHVAVQKGTIIAKSYASNVLSFPYDSHSGEIFLNIRKAAREASAYTSILKPGTKRSPKEHTLYLLIHGCLHLKGLDHGKKMDDLEVRYLKQFSR